jgi:hypothetical protein
MARGTVGMSERWRDTMNRGVVAGTLALALLLGACASGGSSSANTPTVTPPPSQAQATSTATTGSGSNAPTPSPTSGLAGSGSLDICQPVTPTPVQINVPAEIPIYQSGQLKLAEANSPTNTSEFGFCIPDTVSAIGSFYTQALPGKGWSSVKTFENLGTENITATRGSESVTITVSPDTLQQGNSDLLIILQGQ